MTTPLSAHVVQSVYRALLGREVEDEAVLLAHMATGSVEVLIARVDADNKSRFWGINTNIEIVETLISRAVADRKPVAGHMETSRTYWLWLPSD